MYTASTKKRCKGRQNVKNVYPKYGTRETQKSAALEEAKGYRLGFVIHAETMSCIKTLMFARSVTKLDTVQFQK